uniref:28 kDa Metastriate family member n=1 Tax=Rhipicephalus zambeziensis TaxID=60191 RepID=A0A224Y0U5_9ACAR
MCRFSLIAFCLLAASSIQATTTKIYTPSGTVGDNITLQAVIIYDSNFSKPHNPPNTQEEREENVAEDSNDPTENYLRELFVQLQEYLHNKSIMINITVSRVLKMDNLTTFYSKHIINGSKTLQNLISFGDSQMKTPDTVFYLYTWPPNESNPNSLLEVINDNKRHELGVPETSTKGTFCNSSETSAAFIRHKIKSYNHYSTAKATLAIFGIPHFIGLQETDYKKLNETFAKCPIHGGGRGYPVGC